MGISSPAFNKEEEPSLTQQHTDHGLQPMQKHHYLKLLFFSNELLFETTLVYFLPKSHQHRPLSFVLRTCLWFYHSLLLPYWNSLLFPNKDILLVK